MTTWYVQFHTRWLCDEKELMTNRGNAPLGLFLVQHTPGRQSLLMSHRQSRWITNVYLIIGSFTSVLGALLAVYLAQFWILRPKFKVELRDITDGSGKMLLITSINHSFSPDDVHLLIAMDKATFDKNPPIQIREGKMGWIPLICDTQDKNIHKQPHKVLSMTIPQLMHPKAPTGVLVFKRFDSPLEIYYAFRTKYGPYPKNDSPKVIESGKLPKIKIF